MQDSTLPTYYRGSAGPLSNIDCRHHQPMVGREALLRDLAAALSEGVSPGPIVTITGVLGVGKKRLAAEYACRNHSTYLVTYRFRAGEPSALLADYVQLAHVLGLPERDASDQQVIVRAVRAWLEKSRHWLLVFEDARDVVDLRDYVPRERDSTCHILITSRNPNWPASVRVLRLAALDRDESQDFITGQLGHGLRPNDLTNLVSALGGLPWALETACRYIAETHGTVGEYVKWLRESPDRILQANPFYTGPHPAPDLIWQRAIQYLQRDAPAGLELLNLCSCLGAGPIAVTHLRKGIRQLAGDGPAIGDPILCDQALAILQREGLIDVVDGMASLHRFHAALATSRLSPSDAKRWTGYAARMLCGAMPDHAAAVRRWSDYEALVSHAKVVLKRIARLQVEEAARADLLRRLALYHRGTGRFRRAASALKFAMNTGRRLGTTSEQLARDLVGLGDVASDLAQWSRARRYYHRAQGIYQRSLGTQHWQLATVLSKLALVCRAEGDWEGALALAERAVHIDALPTRATYYDWRARLARLWRILIEPTRRTEKLERWLHRLGTPAQPPPHHPDSSAILRAYGQVLLDVDAEPSPADPAAGQRRVLEEEQFRRALALDEDKHKGDHPSIARDWAGLGEVRLAIGALDEALAAFRKALAMDETLLGPDHPLVADDLRSMAEVLLHPGQAPKHNRGRHPARQVDESLALARRALEIDHKCFTLPHPHVALDQVTLGRALCVAGQLEQGLTSLREALRTMERVSPRGDPLVARIADQLADGLSATSQALEESSTLYERAVDLNVRYYGTDHHRTVQVREKLVRVLQKLGRTAETRRHLQILLRDARSKDPQDVPRVAGLLNDLALALHDRGSRRRALQYLDEAVAMLSRDQRGAAMLPIVQANLAALREEMGIS